VWHILTSCCCCRSSSFFSPHGQLLEEDGRNADVLEWLGKRYAEKLDFASSYAYYKRATDMRNPARSSVETRDLWVTRGKTEMSTEDDAYLKNISKSKRIEFENEDLQADIVYRSDDHIASGLRDYAWPEKKHMGSTIVLYEKPAQGWAYGIRMQRERQTKLGLDDTLPKTTNYRQTDKELGLGDEEDFLVMP
jgi:hypothetical protein